MRYPVITTLALAILSGCTVGPDYSGPPQSLTTANANARLPHDQNPASHQPAVAQWWLDLHDAELNWLVTTALANSPDIAQAQAKLKQSRAGLREQQASAYPSASTNATMIRMRSPDLSQFTGGDTGGGRAPLSLYLVNFDASWEADLFGGTRRAIEAAHATAQATAAELADTQVQLVAEVVQNYVDLRDRQARLALVEETVTADQQIVDLTFERRNQGVTSELQVEQVLTQADSTRAKRLPLQAQIIESLDQLALLCGLEPGTLDDQLTSRASMPLMPEHVPITNPTQLLMSRPDIRIAERELASATAQIGEKKADWFPKLSLLGDLGFSAGDPGHLARKSNGTWLLIPRLTWNALDFGRTKAAIEQAESGRDLAQAKYRKTVLNALRDADSSLARYGYQRQHVAMLIDIQRSAERAAELTQQRYRSGTANTLDWLDAERTRFNAQQERISGEGQLLKDFAALHKALGLGWQQ
ncbi:efflux transporter outer membrane subunit [Pseudomonas bharatica]|uniref:efflux transporter outer membrane subunit n=1 Tax=Pseudomonas bharatica TaxID=2692112 RepID=UPI003B287AFE